MVAHWWWAAGPGTTLTTRLVTGAGADWAGRKAGSWDHALTRTVETDAESLFLEVRIKNIYVRNRKGNE